MDVKKGLLDELLRLTGGLYISDLRSRSVRRKIKNIVARVEKQRFDDEEWREAFAYITGRSVSGQTEENIREMFKDVE